MRLLGRYEQKLITRYDPRDLSRVWVRHPNGRHVEARYKNLAREPISLWEHSRAMARLREQGRQEVSEEILFQAIREQRRIEDEALRSSRQARRAVSQRPSLTVSQVIDAGSHVGSTGSVGGFVPVRGRSPH